MAIFIYYQKKDNYKDNKNNNYNKIDQFMSNDA